MKSASQFSLILATTIACSGSIILPGTGTVSLDNGVSDRNSRGYGRGVGFDLSSPNFHFLAGEADTSRYIPGIISGGFASPAQSAFYPRPGGSNNLTQLTLNDQSWFCRCGGRLNSSSASVALPLLPDPGPYPRYLTFDLPSVPVSVTGNLAVITGTYMSGDPIIESIAIYGEGYVTMKGGYGLQSYSDVLPSYYIWSTTYTFTFAEVPEPYSIGLLAAGLAVVLIARLLLKHFHV